MIELFLEIQPKRRNSYSVIEIHQSPGIKGESKMTDEPVVKTAFLLQEAFFMDPEWKTVGVTLDPAIAEKWEKKKETSMKFCTEEVELYE